MTSRMDELEDLIISGRKPTSNIIKAIQRRFAGEGNLTNTEKRKLQALKRRARKNVDIENMFRDIPELDVTVTKKRTLPTGKGGTEPLFKKDASPRLGSPKPKSSVKDVAPLGGSSYKIKSGDTLSAIARRNNTTVAALMKLNPKITDKDKIRAGQFIKVGSPEKAKAKAKSVKDLRGKPTSIAEAKRRGMSEYFDTKTKTMKAAVTAEELKKSGLTLREYINKMKKKKMNMGGMMSAVGSSAANRKRNTATGLSGMKRGGMTMKKKGYAKGGMMKKKGYSKGGAMPMGKDPKTGKMIPKFAMDGKGKMARGGMTMKKKGMARGGAMMKKKGMAKGGATRRGR